METLLTVSNIGLWLISLLNLFIGIGLVRHVQKLSAPTQPDLLPTGQVAPEFNLKTLDERTLTLSDFQNRKLLMVFMSAECGHCRPQMPLLKDIAPKARKDLVDILLVGLGETTSFQNFVNEFELDIPVAVTDRGGPFLSAYKVAGTPSYYLINSEGKIERGGFFDQKWSDLISNWRASEVT